MVSDYEARVRILTILERCYTPCNIVLFSHSDIACVFEIVGAKIGVFYWCAVFQLHHFNVASSFLVLRIIRLNRVAHLLVFSHNLYGFFTFVLNLT